MAHKKTTDEAGGLVNGALMLFETVSHGVERAVQGALENLEQGALGLFHKLLRSAGFFFFSVLGAVFLLIGTARVLDTAYQLPGLGEIVIGAFIFAGVLLLHMIDQQK